MFTEFIYVDTMSNYFPLFFKYKIGLCPDVVIKCDYSLKNSIFD